MEGGRCRGFRRRRCDFECNNGHPAHGQRRGWRKHQNCRECFPGFMFDRNHGWKRCVRAYDVKCDDGDPPIEKYTNQQYNCISCYDTHSLKNNSCKRNKLFSKDVQ